ncbi:MFS transporter [Bacterioplanes sanyensis]|uniref:MFS transporter n=1 Tax=Bacterioplanes sanyensis TaxID=1249553 RepID=A0A222FJQ6_9GAMM|nr:MFS transporter [Bacterioplanes sanyensis]ASP38872.1 MFS transporter [Bacterioplanes sanyensis]
MSPSSTEPFAHSEQRAVASLASLYATRMLGLFMVLPVMMVEGQKLAHATPALLGLAMGVYGLTQALLQIPAGALSDRFGRKPVIITGLLIFALGSLIAALSDSVYGVILGRALQGAGAIASAIMALVTDLTREEHRMKAMASIGASIGLSFSVALIAGPWLASIGGLESIFGLTAVLALLGVAVTIWVIPTPTARPHRDASAVWPEVKKQLSNRQLWPLNIGIFVLHALMVAIFVAIPLQLINAGLSSQDHTWMYLPVLLLAFVLMVPFIIVAEKRRQMKSVVLFGAIAIVVSLMSMSVSSQLWHWALALLVYFWGFNLMEASLPSWLSKVAPAGAKGSAMGIYSSMQFFGAFIGGSAGGLMLSAYGHIALFVSLALLVLAWAVMVMKTPAPKHLTSLRMTSTNALSDAQLAELQALQGVAEVTWLADEAAIYLKISADEFDYSAAQIIINPAQASA